MSMGNWGSGTDKGKENAQIKTCPIVTVFIKKTHTDCPEFETWPRSEM